MDRHVLRVDLERAVELAQGLLARSEGMEREAPHEVVGRDLVGRALLALGDLDRAAEVLDRRRPGLATIVVEGALGQDPVVGRREVDGALEVGRGARGVGAPRADLGAPDERDQVVLLQREGPVEGRESVPVLAELGALDAEASVVLGLVRGKRGGARVGLARTGMVAETREDLAPQRMGPRVLGRAFEERASVLERPVGIAERQPELAPFGLRGGVVRVPGEGQGQLRQASAGLLFADAGTSLLHRGAARGS